MVHKYVGSEENENVALQPEMFEVEGEACENKTPVKSPYDREKMKKRRNKGLEYASRSTGKIVRGRLLKPLGLGCDRTKSRCNKMEFFCSKLSDTQRQKIREAILELEIFKSSVSGLQDI